MARDAVVIGAGHNGLVAANLLADAGWSVVVLEEASDPGGAVRSGQLIEPGFTHDLFSSFYPFALASPHIRALELERWGVRWLTPQVAVAHPTLDGACPAVCLDIDATAASLDELVSGDGDAWRALYAQWEQVREGALGAFFSPFPPMRAASRLLRDLGPEGILRLARFSLLSVRRLGEETFSGEAGTRLLAGNALHADVSPEAPLSGVYGWVLCCLAQQHGFPIVAGGAGGLTQALIRRLRAGGGELLCEHRATRIECRGGAAVAVHAGEHRFEATRAVIADVGPPQLYGQLLAEESASAQMSQDVKRFQYDNGTVKVDWTLEEPIPFTAPRARRAGTVHVAPSLDALTRQASELACGLIPSRPYLVMGQYAHTDPSRAPEGKDTAWAYTHVPQRVRGDAGEELSGSWDEPETERFAERIEAQVELLAPGFRNLIRGRHVFTPSRFEAGNRNLVAGALNGGTAQIHQQLVFRPFPGVARPETAVRRLFLGSASAHPGGGVHGGPGANAAKAALDAASRIRLNAFGRLGRLAARGR